MAFDGFPDEALIFYERLLADNSKAFWTDNKAVYERAVRAPMLALLAELGDAWGEAKVFRPYRDTRFSADKSPYKTHQGAFCEAADGVGYYVQVDADGVLSAGGFHAHSRDQVARYRAAVDDDASGADLTKITAKLAKAGFSIEGDRVRTRPRGVPADHPRLELMRHASLVAVRRHPPGPSVHTAEAASVVRDDWRALRPLVRWVEQWVGPHGA